MRAEERAFAVVGGGRWARVFLSVMGEFDFPYRVAVVSSANALALAGMRAGRAGEIEVLPSIDDLRRYGPIAAALVVNPAVSHADTVCRLLELSVPVLVEKPIALKLGQLERIYSAASASRLLVMPALTFLHCSYLQNFARAIGDYRHASPTRVRLEWHDPIAERRHGEYKFYDVGISVAQDVMPHVWAILAVTLDQPVAVATVRRCAIERGGRDVRYALSVDGMACDVHLQREATARRRFIVFEWDCGATLALDFTVEPGLITAGAQSFSADPEWYSVRRPVRRQLDHFISELSGATAPGDWRSVAAMCTSLVEQSDDALKQEQAAFLHRTPFAAWNDDIAYAVQEALGPWLLAAKRVIPGDGSQFRHQLDQVVGDMRSRSDADNWYSALQPLKTSDAQGASQTPDS